MEDAFFVSDGRLGEVVMTKFDCVKEKKGFGGGVNDLEAAVVVAGGGDVGAIAATEGPGLGGAGFVVDEDCAADGSNGKYSQSDISGARVA